MSPDLPKQKTLLRASLRHRLDSMPADERGERSLRVVQRMLELPSWQQAVRVLLFAPLPAEPDLDLLWSLKAFSNKRAVYPRLDGTRMRLYQVDQPGELERTRWGLREPPADPCREVALDDCGVVLVPGLAFDQVGGRLGRGGGFYDRLLEQRNSAKTWLIGVCFAWQQVADALPLAAHDVKMDAVCTD